jgi:hypothetical protein
MRNVHSESWTVHIADICDRRRSHIQLDAVYSTDETQLWAGIASKGQAHCWSTFSL